jgi:hypothetical protein
MPFMQTDLQKIMGMEFSEDKVQYLVYQMLKGLKVGGAYMVAKATSLLRASPLLWGRGGFSMLVWKLTSLIHISLSLSFSLSLSLSLPPSLPPSLPFSTSTPLASSTG